MTMFPFWDQNSPPALKNFLEKTINNIFMNLLPSLIVKNSFIFLDQIQRTHHFQDQNGFLAWTGIS